MGEGRGEGELSEDKRVGGLEDKLYWPTEVKKPGRQAIIGASHKSNLFAGFARRKQPDLLTSEPLNF